MLLFPRHIDPPLLEFSFLPLFLFVFKLGKLIYLYQRRMRCGLLQIAGALFAGIALSHTIASAVLQGLFTQGLPFFRTPKNASPHAFLRALSSVREEMLFVCVLFSLAYLLLRHQGITSIDMHVWVVVLLVQALPYCAAVFISLLSAFPAVAIRKMKAMPEDEKSL